MNAIVNLTQSILRQIHNGEWEKLDNYIATRKPEQMTDTACVCVARNTFCVKDKLPSWEDYINRSRKYLASKGKPHILKGLYNEN